MNIQFTAHRYLDELGRTVSPGETLAASATISAELLQAYVNNGIATIEKTATKPAAKISDGGDTPCQ